MNKRLQKKLEAHKREHIRSSTSWAVLLCYLIGGISAIYAGNHFIKTLIDYMLPILLAVVAGVIFSLPTSRYLKAYSGKKFRYYGHLFWSILTFGGFITGLFFLLNSVFATAQTETLKKRIVEVKHVAKRGNLYVEIDMGNYSKDIRVDKEEKQQVEAATYLVFTVQKGFFGYNIIKEVKLSKE